MKTLNLVFGAVLISLSIMSCDKDDDKPLISCDKQVVISAEEYNTGPNHALTIHNLVLDGACLKINFSSGGCNGDSWELGVETD